MERQTRSKKDKRAEQEAWHRETALYRIALQSHKTASSATEWHDRIDQDRTQIVARAIKEFVILQRADTYLGAYNFPTLFRLLGAEAGIDQDALFANSTETYYNWPMNYRELCEDKMQSLLSAHLTEFEYLLSEQQKKRADLVYDNVMRHYGRIAIRERDWPFEA